METKRNLLVVEDDLGIQNQLRWCFDDVEVAVASNRDEAIASVRRFEPRVVTLDMGLPPDAGGTSEGLKTLEQILSLAPSTKVVVVTGNDDRASAVKAVALGAFDFYMKPIDVETLKIIVNRAFRVRELEDENRRLQQISKTAPLNGLIASSPEMLKVTRTIEKVAPTTATTLLLGESGTGKELLARALHDLSPRKNQKFVAINCAAIPETLLESELFGHEKGAFTGAVKQTAGKIEMADKGTLFLDEIGDLPVSLQAKLLRFLQQRVIERIGSRQEISVDVRVVCATHQQLPEMIKNGTFREDLFYRISEITVQIPPLRSRKGDTVLIARVFLEKFAQQMGKKVKSFTQDALTAIENYSWPGNVRELENKVKRAVILSDSNQITAEELELSDVAAESVPFNLREVRETAERKAILRALSFSNYNVAQTSELLGISRPTLYDLMKKLNIKVND